MISNLTLIGEELWFCHVLGINVYDRQWNTLREIRLNQNARGVAALDMKTVIIATDVGLVKSSFDGVHAYFAD